MNILYCIPQLYNSGGMERVVTQKVNYLTEHTNHKIDIVTTECTPKGTKTSYFPLNRTISIHELGIDFDSDFSSPLLVKWWHHERKIQQYHRQLLHLIRQRNIDLCISTGGKEIAFLHQLPCHTMAEFHFSLQHRQQQICAFHSGLFWKLLGIIRTHQLIRAVRPLSHFVVLTEADCQNWQKVGCNNVVCIPNPCSLDGTDLPIAQRDSRTVLAVGRLHPQKGFDMLLSAWAGVIAQHPDWRLMIVGEGPSRTELEQLIQHLHISDSVDMLGTSMDMVSIYQKASLLVLSSRYEGLPLALIEGMWCGIPCVAFDCPSGPRQLLDDGRGVLLPAQDTQALANAIIHLINHPNEANAMGKKAQKYAQEQYAQDIIMLRWITLFESCK